MDEEAPSGVNPRIPNMARMYDYALGGKDNFAADREAVQKLFGMSPENRYVPLANRRFLRRAVRYAVEQGIDQFLDLGAGLPSQGNVHEVAPTARVVYVDHDRCKPGCAHDPTQAARFHTKALAPKRVSGPSRVMGRFTS